MVNEWTAARKTSRKSLTMLPITIPESAHAALQNLINLSASDFKTFLDALTRAEPSLDASGFWRHVAIHLKQVDQAVIQSILHEIFQMDDARSGMDVAEFAEAIAIAAASGGSKTLNLKTGDQEILKDRIIRIFESKKGLRITMKAAGVLTDQDHSFLSARILTDIRPVFNDKGDSADAAVIVHNLIIHYGIDSDHKDFYVALDTSDIQSIREVLDRADEKAKSLQRLLKSSGVTYLDVEE